MIIIVAPHVSFYKMSESTDRPLKISVEDASLRIFYFWILNK